MMKGFTLIELVVTFALIGMLMVGSYFSFRTYSQTQNMQVAVSDVSQQLNLAKSKSLAQVKPSVCGTQVLQGYQVSITLPKTSRLEVVCGTTTSTINTKILPAGSLNFTNASTPRVFFAVATAVVALPGNIVLSDGSQTKTIRTDSAGKISVQ